MSAFIPRNFRGFNASDEFNEFISKNPSIEEVLAYSTIEDEINSNNHNLMKLYL